MSLPDPARTAKHRTEAEDAVARQGDLIMLATLGVSTLAGLAIGLHFGQGRLAGWGAGALVALGLAGFLVARGTLLSQVLLVVSNAAMVMLHIQLGRGTVEFHFGVFVLLGMVLVYRDWRPLVLAAGLFAVHHIVSTGCRPRACRCTARPNPIF